MNDFFRYLVQIKISGLKSMIHEIQAFVKTKKSLLKHLTLPHEDETDVLFEGSDYVNDSFSEFSYALNQNYADNIFPKFQELIVDKHQDNVIPTFISSNTNNNDIPVSYPSKAARNIQQFSPVKSAAESSLNKLSPLQSTKGVFLSDNLIESWTDMERDIFITAFLDSEWGDWSAIKEQGLFHRSVHEIQAYAEFFFISM
jgi:hypothetical protein